MANLKWLHFSDFHVSPKDQFDMNLARKTLIKHLKTNKCDCDYLFFTGDIVEKKRVFW